MLASSDQIEKINTQIESCLDVEDIDFDNLKTLVYKRENAIAGFLNGLDTDSAKLFAQQELQFQERLTQTLDKYFQLSKDELSKLLNARKLAAKYK